MSVENRKGYKIQLLHVSKEEHEDKVSHRNFKRWFLSTVYSNS
jgi:hypothetical protein